MRVFLSCVSSEFKSYRLRLANQLDALRDCSFEVKVQEDFQQGGYTLLDKLAEYIRECDLVIHLAGNACGAPPTTDHIRALFHSLGEEAPDPLPEWSYTQWEYQLGCRFHRAMLVYFAAAEAKRDWSLPLQQTEQEDRCQQLHLAAIRQSGKHYAEFDSYNALVRKVFSDLGLQAELKINNMPNKSLGSLFKGRADFLRKIHDALGSLVYHGFESSATISTSVAAVAVHGLGGVGKTRLVTEYAHRYAEEYTALLFVLADSPSGLQQNLAALCIPMVFDLPEKDAREIEVQVAAVQHWLQQHAGWLLIFDNADTEEAAQAVQDLLGKLTPSGQVLVTSRLSNWPGALESLAVDVLQEADAAAFLLERTQGRRRKTSDDDAMAHRLVVELGQLALALEQAGAYIERYRFTLAEYFAEWLERRDKVLAWSDARLMQYPSSVAVTWQVSFDRLSNVAQQLLRVLAWFAPDPVPESLLQAGGETFAPLGREALADLDEHSLVTRADDTASFAVHRLVQDVTRRNSQQNSTHIADLTGALSWLNKAFVHDSQDVRTWPVLAPLAPHALTVTRHADAEHIGDPTARLMNELGAFYHAQAQYADAELLYRRALAINERLYGLDHIELATCLNNLAALLSRTNRFSEAEPLYRRALSINEGFHGPDHPDVASALTNLAQLLQSTNRLDEAEPLMRRALEIDEKACGPDHYRVGIVLGNLARLLHERKRLAEAERLMRRSVEIIEKNYGPDHPLLATGITNLAQLLKDANRMSEAEPLMRQALVIDEKAYSADHPDVARDLNNLGALLYRTNRLGEAEPLFRRALEIDEKAYGPDHADVARDLNNLSALLQDTNRLDEAETLLRRVVRIFQGVYGSDHPNFATSLNNLAALLLDTNRLEEAEPLLRQAVAVDEHAGGTDDANVARDLGNLARLLQNAKRWEEAEPLLRRILKIYEEACEPDRSNIALGLNNLATFLHRMDRFEEAEPLMWRVLAIDEEVYGPTHPILFTDLTNLATLLRSTNRLTEAEPLLRRTLELFFALLRDTGYQHPNLQAAMVNYAGLLQQMGYPPTQVRTMQNEIAKGYGFSLDA